MEANGVLLPGPDVEPMELKVGDTIAEIAAFITPMERDLNLSLEFKRQHTRVLNELLEREAVLLRLEGPLSHTLEVPSGPPDDVKLQEEPHSLRTPLISTRHDLESGSGSGNAERNARFHSYICGAIDITQRSAFERMLFRVSRGNAYVRFVDIEEEVEDPATGDFMLKSAFYVVYIGDVLEKRIRKMCEFMRCNVYDLPDDVADFQSELKEMHQHAEETRNVLTQTQRQIVDILEKFADDGNSSPLRDWQEVLRRESCVCNALKKCKAPDESTVVVAEGWCPQDEVGVLRRVLYDAAQDSGTHPPVVEETGSNKTPPTYFKVNKFTSVFQGIVDTYGVPRYQEANPALFTIVTFPFLFGIMYGDIGHGTFLSVFSLLMVLFEDRLGEMKRRGTLGEIPTMAYGGRYMLLMMGIFAIYCGFIYNECMSIPLDLFGTNFKFAPGAKVAQYQGGVYSFGVDPSWYHMQNELSFFNSLKKKLSVIFGVIHMTFGIILGLFNHLYFKDTVSIFAEFVPQLLFMLCTFGYMIFMIILKWTIDFVGTGREAPNLIQSMIKMYLSPGTVAAKDELYSGQATIQIFLVLITVICMPWMLLAKPYVKKWQHNSSNRGGDHNNNNPRRASINQQGHEMSPLRTDDDEEYSNAALLDPPMLEDEKSAGAGAGAGAGAHGDSHGSADGEFDFSEAFIYQAIHTIEFILGCVSNTASYLRLWALSLAHAELADVFWEKLIMQYGVNTGSPIMTVVGFGAWFGATAAVLLAMDVLECFLHALRLHWVEFQNKFYHADGVKFVPFTFEPAEED
jgi:V-type H+-transporting ATPase subunit a